MRPLLTNSAWLLMLLLLTGCGSRQKVEVIDLNKVLDILAKVLDEEAPASAAAKGATPNDNKSGPSTTKVVAVTKDNEDEQTEKVFLKRFADELNAAKLMSKPLGVSLLASGAVEGFTDANRNMKRDGSDKKVFTVQIDPERNRLVASDTAGHNRDHSYHYRPGFGFFSGYLLGSMLGRQNSYYSGARAGARPNFRSMRMSPRNYHSSAVSQARSRASSARSRSGSRGFSFGK